MAKLTKTGVLLIFLVATWSIVKGQDSDANSTADDQSQAEIRSLVSDDLTAKYNFDEPQQTTIYRSANPDNARRIQLLRLLSHISRNQHDMYELGRALSLQNKKISIPATFANYLSPSGRLNIQQINRLAQPMSRLDLAELAAMNAIGHEDALANEGVAMKPLSTR